MFVTEKELKKLYELAVNGASFSKATEHLSATKNLKLIEGVYKTEYLYVKSSEMLSSFRINISTNAHALNELFQYWVHLNDIFQERFGIPPDTEIRIDPSHIGAYLLADIVRTRHDKNFNVVSEIFEEEPILPFVAIQVSYDPAKEQICFMRNLLKSEYINISEVYEQSDILKTYRTIKNQAAD